MRWSSAPETIAAMLGARGDRGDAELRAGDHVRLTRAQADVPAGAVGLILGFIRRERVLVVVKFDGFGQATRVHPEDIERLR
jgi:hypothetical protein